MLPEACVSRQCSRQGSALLHPLPMIIDSMVFDDLGKQRHLDWTGELHSEFSFLVVNPMGTDCKGSSVFGIRDLEPALLL